MDQTLVDILNPQAPMPYQVDYSPPKNEQDLAQRASGWEQALTALKGSPAAQQALMFFGARMLAGRKPGQTTGGAAGEAMFGATSMYNQLEQNAADQQLKQQEAERRNQLAGAQTEDIRSQTEMRRIRAPLELRKLDAELKIVEEDLQRRNDPASLENVKRRLDSLMGMYTIDELEKDPELAKRVARAGLLKQEYENIYRERLGEAAMERADKTGAGGGETFAERRFRELQDLEDKAAELWAMERSQGIAQMLKENKKLTPAGAAMQWDVMNPFNLNIYRAKARMAGKGQELTANGTTKEPTKPMSIKDVEAALATKSSTAPEGKLLYKVPTPPLYDPMASLKARQTSRIAELTKILSERYDEDLYAELQALKNAQLNSQIPMTFPGR